MTSAGRDDSHKKEGGICNAVHARVCVRAHVYVCVCESLSCDGNGRIGFLIKDRKTESEGQKDKLVVLELF